MEADKILPYLYQLMGYGMVLVLLTIIILINKVAQDKILNFFKIIYKKIISKEKNIIHINEEILYVFETISTDLTTIKSKCNSDRASIFEFHNGDYFISKNSRYKMSCTYEKTSPGVSSEALNLQNLDISLFWDDFLKPFFIKSEDSLPEGFLRLSAEPASCSLKSCSSTNSVFLIDVAKMSNEERITKSILEKQGISYLIMQSITNSKGVVYGYVVFDYLDEKPDLKNIRICDICKFTKQIALLWESDEVQKNNAMKYKKQIFSNN